MITKSNHRNFDSKEHWVNFKQVFSFNNFNLEYRLLFIITNIYVISCKLTHLLLRRTFLRFEFLNWKRRNSFLKRKISFFVKFGKYKVGLKEGTHLPFGENICTFQLILEIFPMDMDMIFSLKPVRSHPFLLLVLSTKLIFVPLRWNISAVKLKRECL